MSLSNNFPTVSPTLNLNFAAAGRLDSRVTFTRSSTATYTNQIGLIQSAAVNEPRFDYDPSTLAARGLLIEEQRTNNYLNSANFAGSGWSLDGTATISANVAISPDGTQTADLLVCLANGDSVYQIVNLSSGVTYTGSFYIKYYSGDVNVRIQVGGTSFAAGDQNITFNSQTGALVSNPSSLSYSVTAVGNGWYRYTVTRTASASGNSYWDVNANTAAQYFIWGAQLEQGGFPTSYIPTVAASVTRSADVASVNTLSPWWNNVEGTFLFDFNQVGTADIGSIGDDTFENTLRFNIVNMARGSGSGFANVVLLGTSQNGAKKLAVAMKLNDYAGSFNGAAVSTQTTASMVPTPSVFGIGRGYGTSGYINGHLRRIAYYSARLTNAQLVALTL